RAIESRSPWRRIVRRVTRLFLLSAGLFVIVGLTRYFQGVWQQAPSTPNPFDTTWLIIILIALVTGTIILGLFSLFYTCCIQSGFPNAWSARGCEARSEHQ